MTDAKRKRRPRLQLHLSTCVVLMFAAGGLIGANLTIRRGPIYSEGFLVAGADIGRGFPLLWKYIAEEEWADGPPWISPKARTIALVANAGFGLAALFIIALVSELLIRCRARKRQGPAP